MSRSRLLVPGSAPATRRREERDTELHALGAKPQAAEVRGNVVSREVAHGAGGFSGGGCSAAGGVCSGAGGFSSLAGGVCSGAGGCSGFGASTCGAGAGGGADTRGAGGGVARVRVFFSPS